MGWRCRPPRPWPNGFTAASAKNGTCPSGRGSATAPGYPACPEQSDQEKYFRLLDATKAIGITLTEAFMMVPEQSTSAIVIHHPECEYFAVR